MDKIKPDHFRVKGKADLAGRETRNDLNADDDALKDALDEVSEKLGKLQDVMYAHNRYGVLICLQGMDTSGKDSMIREVFKFLNVRGVVVHSFKVPSVEELDHDYLWRQYKALPPRGSFAIFNRSHYESVLVTRVHPEYLLNERLPGIESVDDIPHSFWKDRFKQIVNFEEYLSENGIIVLKFFLHISKEEQRERLLRRLVEEKHHWKFSPGDLKERERWDDYQDFYEDAISATSKKNAPWFVIPADNKEASRVMVAKIILETIRKYADISEPETEPEIEAKIAEYMKVLSKEKPD